METHDLLFRATINAQVGTQQWCAPEVLHGESYDEKVDVYSFGIFLYELASRQLPYASLSADTLRRSGPLHLQVARGLRPSLDEPAARALPAALVAGAVPPAGPGTAPAGGTLDVVGVTGMPARAWALAQRCWATDAESRPPMSAVVAELVEIHLQSALVVKHARAGAAAAVERMRTRRQSAKGWAAVDAAPAAAAATS